jgi:hypothetical protein
MSHLSVQTKLESFFKPALLCSETSTNCESFIDEEIYHLFMYFNRGSTVIFLFILISTTHIIKISIYLCFKVVFCLFGLLMLY